MIFASSCTRSLTLVTLTSYICVLGNIQASPVETVETDRWVITCDISEGNVPLYLEPPTVNSSGFSDQTGSAEESYSEPPTPAINSEAALSGALTSPTKIVPMSSFTSGAVQLEASYGGYLMECEE